MPVDTKRRLGGAPTATGGAPAAGAAQPAASAAQPAAQRQVGTGFVNMSDILAANQSGAKAMGQALASRVEGQGQSAKAGIDTAANTFAQQVGQGTPVYKEKGLTDRNELRTRAARTYTGPRTWTDAGQNTAALAGQAASAQDNARALTSQGGRAALLQQQSPGLTAGGASLDAFLAGAGMGGRGQQIAADYGNLSDILAGQQGSADAQVAAAEAHAKDASQRYTNLEAQWDAQDAQFLRDASQAESEDPLATGNEDFRTPGNRAGRNRITYGRP